MTFEKGVKGFLKVAGHFALFVDAKLYVIFETPKYFALFYVNKTLIRFIGFYTIV